MSWLFSQALVAAYSEENSLDGAPSAQLNVMPTPQPFWHNDKMMEPWNPSQFGLTSRPLTEDHGRAVLTSFLADFPVKTSRQPEPAQGLMGQDPDYGWRWPESSVKFDHSSASWRIRQCSLLGGSDEFSETWPSSGTMRNGESWARQTLEPLTNGNESGLWPTVTVHGNYNRKGVSAKSGDGLATAVAKHPTPTASMCTIQDFEQAKYHSSKRPPYKDCYPTPTATNTKAVHMRGPDKGKHRSPRSYMTPTASMGTKAGGRHNGKADTLASQIAELEELQVSQTGQLNPTWVEWLMGWPTGWTDCAAWAMDKSLDVPLRHSYG